MACPAAERFQANEDFLARVTVTDLNHFYRYVAWQDMNGDPAGTFTRVRRLRKAIHGVVDRSIWHSPNGDIEVAVKRMPRESVFVNQEAESDERIVHQRPRERMAEDPMIEMGVYFFLQQQHDVPQYQLKMRACFANSEYVWLATELATGGELFDALAANGHFAENQVRSYMMQLLLAVQYLHRQDIGHRDISLENILLMGRDANAELRLMDFGQAVALRSEDGELLRYFSNCGKPVYRAPEMRVPPQADVEVEVLPGHNAGEINQVLTTAGYICHVLLPADITVGEHCQATTAGYTVPQSDIFACGICMFILAWGSAPWQATLLADRGFMFVFQRGYTRLAEAWGRRLPAVAMQLLERMGNVAAGRRPTADACIQNEWFDEVRRP